MAGPLVAREHMGRKLKKLEQQLHRERLNHRVTKVKLLDQVLDLKIEMLTVRSQLRKEIKRLDVIIGLSRVHPRGR